MKAISLKVDISNIFHLHVITNDESEGHDGHDKVVAPSHDNRNNFVSHKTSSGDNSEENSPIANMSNVEHDYKDPKNRSRNDEAEAIKTRVSRQGSCRVCGSQNHKFIELLQSTYNRSILLLNPQIICHPVPF